MHSTSIVVFVLAISMVLIKSDGQSYRPDHHRRRQQQQQQQQQQRKSLIWTGVQPWQSIGNITSARTGHASVLINDKIYVFGGYFSSESESIYYADAQFFQINTLDGTMISNSLSSTSSFAVGRADLAAAYYAGYVYLVGGFSGSIQLSDVQYGRVETDGRILEWHSSLSSLNFPRSHHQLEVIKSSTGKTYLAAIAGTIIASDGFPYACDLIEVAEIHADGSLGEWNICPSHIRGGRQSPSSSFINDHLYVIGGRGDLSLTETFSDIQYASIQTNGCPTSWTTAAQHTIVPVYGHRAVTINSNTLVLLGGSAGDNNFFSTVQYASLYAEDNELQAWQLDRNQFQIPRSGHTSFQYGNTFIYIIGGQTEQQTGYLNDIQMSAVYFLDSNNV